MKIVDHLNVFNTLICQLSSMGITYHDEDKAITLLCLFHDYWDYLVTIMWFISTYSIYYETIMGAFFYEEMRKISTKETSIEETMVVIGRSTERRKNHRGRSRSKSKGKKSKYKCWFCGKSRHLKKDCWKR